MWFLIIKNPQKLDNLSSDYYIRIPHIIWFLLQLYNSGHIHFPYIIIFFNFLLKGLREFPPLKHIILLEIGLKYIISEHNQGHTRGVTKHATFIKLHLEKIGYLKRFGDEDV